MDRISGADTVNIGNGRRGFADQDELNGVAGTEVNARWLNGVQEELIAIMVAAGIDPNAAQNAQVITAILKLIADNGLQSADLLKGAGIELTIEEVNGADRVRIAITPDVARTVSGTPTRPVFDETPLALRTSRSLPANAASTSVTTAGDIRFQPISDPPANTSGFGTGRSLPYDDNASRIDYYPFDDTGEFARAKVGGVWRPWVRRTVQMTEPLQLYCLKTGNDANSGTVNNSNNAFETHAAAFDYALTFAASGHLITINLGPGDWPPIVMSGTDFPNRIAVVGSGKNVTRVHAGGAAQAVFAGPDVWLQLRNFEIAGATQNAVLCDAGYLSWADLQFAVGMGGAKHLSFVGGARGISVGDWAIKGSGVAHISAASSEVTLLHDAVLLDTPGFSDAFVVAADNGTIRAPQFGFVNAATGKRYRTDLGGAIRTNGGGPNHFPGSLAGTEGNHGGYQ